MTENQRLRELLKEARDVVAGVAFVAGQYAPLRDRIDAALTEPVPDCSRCETLRELADTAAAEQGLAQRRMMEAQKGRDEARAEVEFLRGVGCNELDGTDVRGPCGACLKCARRERDEARARVAEVEKERDAARAEIELLRNLLGEKSVVKTEELNAAWTEGMLVAGDVLRPKIADAFKRGAEAMREAAARTFDGEAINGVLGPYFGNIIRVLPIPEDKS